jgi:hypothetical protein
VCGYNVVFFFNPEKFLLLFFFSFNSLCPQILWRQFHSKLPNLSCLTTELFPFISMNGCYASVVVNIVIVVDDAIVVTSRSAIWNMDVCVCVSGYFVGFNGTIISFELQNFAREKLFRYIWKGFLTITASKSTIERLWTRSHLH